MINSAKKFFFTINFSDKFLFILFSFLPLSLILGNFFINLTFVLISLILIIDLTMSKNLFFLKDSTFKIISLFFLSLLINVAFSIDPTNSLPRVLKILLMIMFVLQTQKIIKKYPLEFENIILSFWAIVFVIVLLDSVFEAIFGFNSLGFQTNMTGRIAGFFGSELVAGSFLGGFAIMFISKISLFFKNRNNLIIFLILVIIITSFLIGERSNFIKLFFSLSLLTFFVVKLNFKNVSYSLLILFGTIFLFINFNEEIKYRYQNQIIFANSKPLVSGQHETIEEFNKPFEMTIENYIKDSLYGAHYNAAFKIFQEHPIFGIGVKNFRLESLKVKYENREYKRTNSRWSTHPHQIHYEFLSETGLFGYISFLVFIITSLFLSIKNYLKYRNYFQLSCILYVAVYLIPFLPSGSFFSTFPSSLFWINYAIMMSYIKNNYIKS